MCTEATHEKHCVSTSTLSTETHVQYSSMYLISTIERYRHEGLIEINANLYYMLSTGDIYTIQVPASKFYNCFWLSSNLPCHACHFCPSSSQQPYQPRNHCSHNEPFAPSIPSLIESITSFVAIYSEKRYEINQ